MTHRVQRSYGHGWEGKADHLPICLVTIHHSSCAVPCFHGDSCFLPLNLSTGSSCADADVLPPNLVEQMFNQVSSHCGGFCESFALRIHRGFSLE